MGGFDPNLGAVGEEALKDGAERRGNSHTVPRRYGRERVTSQRISRARLATPVDLFPVDFDAMSFGLDDAFETEVQNACNNLPRLTQYLLNRDCWTARRFELLKADCNLAAGPEQSRAEQVSTSCGLAWPAGGRLAGDTG